MNRRALLLHLMLALACAGAVAQAAWAANWQSIGPYGGSVFRLARCAAEPAVVYALLYQGGVYRSGDGGRMWRDTSRTLPAADYFDLAADPDDPGSAWVIDRATQGPTRLYHTRDGGSRWRALTAPEGSSVVAAGRGGVVYVAGSGTFARSADQGRTWQSVTASLGPYTGALSIAVDSFHPGLLYAAIGGPTATGIWVTEDGGATWRPTSQNGGPIYVIRADPHQAGVAVGLTANGLLRTSAGVDRDLEEGVEDFDRPGSPSSAAATGAAPGQGCSAAGTSASASSRSPSRRRTRTGSMPRRSRYRTRTPPCSGAARTAGRPSTPRRSPATPAPRSCCRSIPRRRTSSTRRSRSSAAASSGGRATAPGRTSRRACPTSWCPRSTSRPARSRG
jgi:photosystem II stability/assembly factor-like uncharacterized protein